MTRNVSNLSEFTAVYRRAVPSGEPDRGDPSA